MDASWIALITAIVAPTITTLIQLCFDYHHHKKDMEFQRELQIERVRIQAMQASYDEFAQALGEVLSIEVRGNTFPKYMSARMKIIRFLPDDLRDKIFQFDDQSFYGPQREVHRKAVEDLMKEIAKYVYSVDH